MRCSLVSLLAISIFGLLSLPGGESTAVSAETVARRSGYTATATPAEVFSFLRELEQTGRVALRSIGRSVEGRPILAASLGQGPVVLLVGGIHAGECAGKEAILELLADLAANEPAADVVKRLRVIAVPDFNVDGNARRGLHHRPGQVGPEKGVGWRTNAQRLDLNRDFAKLETPEARALVRLIHETNPVLVVDTHTTDGSVHLHDMLLDIPHHPAVPEEITGYLRERLVPALRDRLSEGGFSANWYGNFDRERTSWKTFGFGARYSTEYAGLRGIPAVLCEAYSRIPFERRVRVTRATLDALLELVAADAHRLQRLVAATRESSRQLVGQRLPVDGVLASAGRIKVRVPDEGGTEREVDYLGRVEPTEFVQTPRFYVVDGNECRLVHRLMMHGIPVYELVSGDRVTCEQLVVRGIKRADEPFQRHRLVRVETQSREATVALKPGTFLVPTSHPLSRLAVVLLEPSSPDSLIAWNFLDHRLRVGDPLPVMRLHKTAPLVTKRLTSAPQRTRLSLEMLFSPGSRVPFSGAMPPAVEWLDREGECAVRIDGRWRRFSVQTGAEEPYFDEGALAAAWREVGVEEQTAKALARRGWDELAPGGTQGVIRHANDLYLVDLTGPSVRRLTQDPVREELVEFSPDGKRIAYVKDYNLYAYDLSEQREIQLTEGGSEALRFGKLDWVYQEELYGRGNYKGFWWSPDGKHLAFFRLDEAKVPRYPVVDHMPVHARIEQEFYPKSGDPLPEVALGIVPSAGGEIAWVDLSSFPSERLIVRVGFTPASDRVWFQVQDREQTWLKLCTAHLDGRVDRTIVEEKSPAWVEVLGEPVWLDDHRFLWLSDRTGNRHVYLADCESGQTRPVTAGDWEVLDLYGVDRDGEVAFIRGTAEDSTRPSVYRVRIADGTVEPLVRVSGSVRARFSPDCRYFVAYHSATDQPVQAWFYAANGRRLWALEPNLADYHIYLEPTVARILTVPARDGFPLNSMLILPARFDPSRRYPVLCYLYGGPQAPVVQQRWTGTRWLWFRMLAQRGIAIWICDNRASSYRGIKHTWRIYGQMGFQELADLEDSLKWLTAQPWVDRDRLAIYGWSYGGYMTAFALCHSRWFRLGLSGAPVTDWHNYDAIYTERYMRMPQNNKEGYERTSLVRAASGLTGRLVLLHGTIDDNVHVANTLQLVRALQRANKRFDLMLYPESRHGVGNPDQVLHLYTYMTRLLEEELLAADRD